MKNRAALDFFTVLKYYLSFRIFEQLALALKTRVCPGIFHCIEYTFYIPGFEQLALALKNRGCREFTALNMYFLLFRIFEQLALALKNTVYPEIFHCIEYVFFIIQDFWATSACPENRVCPENFQARGGAAVPPDPPPRTMLGLIHQSPSHPMQLSIF